MKMFTIAIIWSFVLNLFLCHQAEPMARLIREMPFFQELMGIDIYSVSLSYTGEGQPSVSMFARTSRKMKLGRRVRSPPPKLGAIAPAFRRFVHLFRIPRMAAYVHRLRILYGGNGLMLS